jgi:hypothetical protein
MCFVTSFYLLTCLQSTFDLLATYNSTCVLWAFIPLYVAPADCCLVELVLLGCSACCMALLLMSQITQRRGLTAMQMNTVDCTLLGRSVHANCRRARLRGSWMTPVSAAVLLIYRKNISRKKQFCDIPGFCHSLKKNFKISLEFVWFWQWYKTVVFNLWYAYCWR